MKIEATEVVCNLLMNNLTPSQFQILKSEEEHIICAVSWPFIRTLFALPFFLFVLQPTGEKVILIVGRLQMSLLQ